MHFRVTTTLQFTTLQFEVLGFCHLGLWVASPDLATVKSSTHHFCSPTMRKCHKQLQTIPPAISSFPSFATCVSPSCLRERYKTRKLLQTCHNQKAVVMKKSSWLLRGKYPLIGGKFARAFKNAASTSSYLKDTTGCLVNKQLNWF